MTIAYRLNHLLNLLIVCVHVRCFKTKETQKHTYTQAKLKHEVHIVHIYGSLKQNVKVLQNF